MRVTTPADRMEVETSKDHLVCEKVRGITDRGNAPLVLSNKTRRTTQKFTRDIAASESRRSDFMKVETTVFTSQNGREESRSWLLLMNLVAEREGHALRVVSCRG